jgi:hypothetical protein
MVSSYIIDGWLALDNYKIWRYMDLFEFISILDKKALFFPRTDNLGDPFEGSFPQINVKRRQGMFSTHDGPGLVTISDYYKKFIKCTLISCWHLNDDESDAMWKIYVKGGEGIAIQSTVGRLKTSLLSYPKHSTISVGKVAYINYDKDKIPDDTLAPYFRKRKIFIHEREYRAIIQSIKYKDNGDIDFSKSTFKKGLDVNVDFENLIENVYLSPTCPLWQKEVAQSILKKYNLKRNIKQSKLSDKPQY